MVGQITGKMFDQSIEKDCVSDLSGPASCRIGPVRQLAGPENAVIQNLAALHYGSAKLATNASMFAPFQLCQFDETGGTFQFLCNDL